LESNQSFFSYSRKDAEFVFKLATDLKNAGLNVWLDQLDILPGEPYDIAIEKALKQSDCMLIVLSTTSTASENVLNEIDYAKNRGKRIIPLLINDCEVPLSLVRKQRIDFTKDYNTAFQQLVKTLNPPNANPQPAIPVIDPSIKENKPAEDKIGNTKPVIPKKNEVVEEDKQNEKEKKKRNFKLTVLISIVSLIILLAISYKIFSPPGNNSTTDNTNQRHPLTDTPSKQDSSSSVLKKDDTSKITNRQTTSNPPLKVDTSILPARIYITFAQGNTIDNSLVLSRLKDSGFTFPNTPKVRTTSETDRISVNYYYPEDKVEAEKLLQILKEICLPQQPSGTTKLIKGVTRRRHYDVWLSLK